MEPRAQFEALVKDGVAPLLKAHGFRRQNQTFHRRVGRNWTLVNLQKSRETTAEQVIFYLNLGVSSALLTEFDGRDPEKRPAALDCDLLERLNPPSPRDRWVLDHESMTPDRLKTTLGALLAERGLPWLARQASDEGLRDFLLGRDLAYWGSLVVLLTILGPKDALEALLAKLRRNYKYNAAKLAQIEEHLRRVESFAAARTATVDRQA